MAKYSMKRDGKEVGQADVYAEPHTMSGKKVSVGTFSGRNAKAMPEDCISIGNISKVDYDEPPKKQTMKIRGCGAATKGTMASDKMG